MIDDSGGTWQYLRITWARAEALAAIEQAPSLSALLKNEAFYESGALSWLTPQHLTRFAAVIDEDEAINLFSFAEGWSYPPDRAASRSLTLLESIESLSASSENLRSVRRLIARLAMLKPDWVARWWKYTKKTRWLYHDLLTKVLVSALTAEEFQCLAPKITDQVVAAIVTMKPDFLDLAPAERLGPILTLAIEGEGKIAGLPEMLSIRELPSDATAIIDGLLEL